ncbi:hypothetical protein W97_01590 [Coniosporium apollinis CBS 100218]|uniref:Phosphatidate phosphatase APP1 catalytic domain-containing protein n=1 Tax=Coniosporium apollinis (strain CBS 100218) TaxID=1168221 RepID=R7YKF2_CONA1|nr:uncharacterized protein W97_01590 [Coniosporium apollinis CBS 100218]EON62368.1 hypothetical protein W97_01590 [Coniosporium apollinis CBS 100218]
MDYINMAAKALQATQDPVATEQERALRDANDFDAWEAVMPALTSRFDSSLADRLSSYLGRRNPFYREVDPKKHSVWIFDNTAYRPSDNPKAWQAEFVAAYFVKGSGRDLSAVAADIAEKIGLGSGDAAEALIAERLRPFVDQILPAHSVDIDIGDKQMKRLGPSGRDGISSDVVRLNSLFPSGSIITTSTPALAPETPAPVTIFAEPEGWAVISDVDDTIKKTLTSSPLGILKTTFAEEPEPIAGMPELYRYLKNFLQNPPFFYLSASPYNLYPFLRRFRQDYYPPGTLILREASWMNLAGFLSSLTRGTEAYKVDRLQKINGWFPQRKMICIGDSTQTDPESYAEAYRRFPGWIKGIYIRKVEGVSEIAVDGEKKNSDERFEKAFRDVPRGVWHVFEDPQELYAKVEGLVKTVNGK